MNHHNNGITHFFKPTARVDMAQGSPHPSIALPIVADKGPTFAQKIANILGPATIPGPITGALFKTSQEVPPKFFSKESTKTFMSKRGMSDTLNYVKNTYLGIRDTSDIESNAIKLAIPPKIKLSKVKRGDIIFKVATDNSPVKYNKIINGQKSQVKEFCSHEDKLPVTVQNVIHAEVAIGNGQIAKIDGPRDLEQWLAWGSKTLSQIVPISALEETTEDYIVMRANNEKVAERMAEKAQEKAEQPFTYSVKGGVLNGLIDLRGELESPSLTGDEQGPQVRPIDIPDSMFCSEFVSNIILDGEREVAREDRKTAMKGSIDRPKLSPAELIDTLAGSGNYQMFTVDQSKRAARPE